MDFSSIKNLITAEKKFLKYKLSLIDTQELKNIHLVKFNENITKLIKNFNKFLMEYQNGMHPRIFLNPLQLNSQSITWNNNHLKPEYKYYKHCNSYTISDELQPFYGKDNAYHIIYHSEDDILENTFFLNCNLGFGSNFPPQVYYKKDINDNKLKIDNPAFLYIIEQTTNGGLEQIHLILIQNEFEVGSKHYFLAKKLNILYRVVEAGEMKRIDDKTIEYNTDSGTWMEFDKKNLFIRKNTPIIDYFDKLGKLNDVSFRKVNNSLINLPITKEDIEIFSVNNNKIFYNPSLVKCCNYNWELVKEDEIDTNQDGIPISLLLNEGKKTVISTKKLNKLLCKNHLEVSTHYSRPLANFIKEPTIENAIDLSTFWPKIIKDSEIDRKDLDDFIDKHKTFINITEKQSIPITTEIFLGSRGTIFRSELPCEIQKFIENNKK
jgi:hypothetical protein